MEGLCLKILRKKSVYKNQRAAPHGDPAYDNRSNCDRYDLHRRAGQGSHWRRQQCFRSIGFLREDRITYQFFQGLTEGVPQGRSQVVIFAK